MTVSSTVRTAGPYPGTGTVTTFAFGFKVFATTDVIAQVTAAGVLTDLVYGSDFTVTLNADQNSNPGGNVILSAPLASGASLVIGSLLSLTQPTRITNTGGFLPQVIEDALDRGVILVQQEEGNVGGAIRVPEIGGVPVLPAAAQRANSLLGFNDVGDAVLAGPVSGSAAELALLLAGSTGGLYVGFIQAWAGAVFRTLLAKLRDEVSVADFGAVGDGVADDSAHFISAVTSGAKRVKVAAGRYLAKNITLDGVHLELDKGAVLVHVLGSTDVGIRLKSGGRISGGELEVTNSVVPIHGGYGCPIAIGYYADISTPVSGMTIEKVKLTCKNASAMSALAISIVGAVSNIRIRDIEVNGAFAIAWQAHWGGTFDEAFPNTSTVSASKHPHDIWVENVVCGADSGHVGNIAFSIAGAGDIKVKNLVSKAWKRAILITPGDVYAQVADAADIGHIMTGIEFDGVTVIDAPNNGGTTAESIIHFNGVSQTSRTPSAPTYTSNGYCSIQIKNIRFSNGTGVTYSGAPLVNCYYGSKARFDVASAIGYEGSSSTLFQMRNSTDCHFVGERIGQPHGAAMVSGGNIACSTSITTRGSAGTMAATTARALTCGVLGAGSTTLAADLSVGDTSVSLNLMAGGFTLVKGTRLYMTNGFITVAGSVLVAGTGTTSVLIDPSSVDQNSGDAVTITGELLQCKLTVDAYSVYVPLELINSAHCSVGITSRVSGKYDAQITGTGNSALHLLCDCSQGGALNDGSTLANVTIGGGHDITINGNFEVDNPTATVTSNIHAASATELYRLTVTQCNFGGATVRAVYQPTQSNSASQNGKNSIFDNKYALGLQPALPTEPCGFYVAGMFIAYMSARPTSGYWNIGDRWIDTTPTVGSPKGEVVTANPGTSPTWSNDGNVV
jgi:hypothetical protein